MHCMNVTPRKNLPQCASHVHSGIRPIFMYLSGIAQAIQNLGLGLISLAVGEITDKYGYFWLEVFMMGCLCFAICTSVVMWLNDYRDENFLNMTISERKRFETTEKYKLMMDMQDEVCLEEPNLPTE